MTTETCLHQAPRAERLVGWRPRSRQHGDVLAGVPRRTTNTRRDGTPDARSYRKSHNAAAILCYQD
jgi:hypothetical protein